MFFLASNHHNMDSRASDLLVMRRRQSGSKTSRHQTACSSSGNAKLTHLTVLLLH